MNSYIHSGNSISPFCDVTNNNDLGCTVDKVFVGQCSLSTFTGNLDYLYILLLTTDLSIHLSVCQSTHPSILSSAIYICCFLLVHSLIHSSIILFIYPTSTCIYCTIFFYSIFQIDNMHTF